MAGDGMEELIVSTFKRFDSNQDGVIDRVELTKVLKALSPDKFDESSITMLMNAADTNKDGKIQYAEFIAWVMAGSPDGAAPGPQSPVSPQFAPLDNRGKFNVDYRVLLPERFKVDIKKRYAMNKLQIGEGGYGQVFVAQDKEFGNRKVAVKKVTKTGQQDEASLQANETLQREIKVMKELDHPNICKLLATFEQDRTMYFIMELCEGGEVFDRIIENGFITEAVCADIISQVAAALAYVHARGIAHRDIKPENVVFCSQDRNDTHIKVIDWGLAMDFLEKPMTDAVGSFTYAAPEVIESQDIKSYTAACDLWSLGVLTYVMLCGKPPFWGTQRQHLSSARSEKYPISGGPWDEMNPHAIDFVKGLLKAKASDRTPVSTACNHPWFTSAKQKDAVSKDHSMEVLKNLKNFGDATTFTRMCIAAVARQMDHAALKDIHAVFRELDANGDGVLCFTEILSGFKRMFGEASDEYKSVDETFHLLDLDGSGSVDYTEFCAAGLGQKRSMQDDVMWAAFKAFDRDNSGYVHKEDLQSMLASADMHDSWTPEICEQVGNEIIQKFDKDGDGQISFEDWKHLMSACWEKKQSVEGPISNPYDLLVQVSKLK